MNNTKVLFSALALTAGLGVLACSNAPAPATTAAPEASSAPAPAASDAAPQFVVDATWPKPYPNKWKIGGVTGLAVDKEIGRAHV